MKPPCCGVCNRATWTAKTIGIVAAAAGKALAWVCTDCLRAAAEELGLPVPDPG